MAAGALTKCLGGARLLDMANRRGDVVGHRSSVSRRRVREGSGAWSGRILLGVLPVALLVAGLVVAAQRDEVGDGSVLAPADLRAGGWQAVGDPDLPPRVAAATAMDDDAFYVFGGHGALSDEIPLSDGARFDRVTGKWAALPDLPAGSPRVLWPDSATVGGDLFVTGTACRYSETPQECDRAGLAVYRYAPADEQWMLLPAPETATTVTGTVLGSVEEDVVIQLVEYSLESRFPALRLVMFDLSDSTWHSIPSPPSRFPVPACVLDTGEIVTLRFQFEVGGVISDEDPTHRDGARPPTDDVKHVEIGVVKFNLATKRWSELPIQGLPEASLQSPEIRCGGPGFVLLLDSSFFVARDGVATDLATSTLFRWRDLIWSGERLVSWNTGVGNLAYTPGASRAEQIADMGPVSVAYFASNEGVVAVYVGASPDWWGDRPRVFMIDATIEGTLTKPFPVPDLEPSDSSGRYDA